MRYAAVMRHGLLADPVRTWVGAGPTATRSAVASTALAKVLGAPEREARVLGASSVALYLHFDAAAGEPSVIAVLASGAVRLPLALVVAGPLPGVHSLGGARVGDGGVTVGSLRVRATRWFDPRPRLDANYESSRIDDAERLLANLPSDASGVAGFPVNDIAAGLIRGDAQPALLVIGRGPGLTPAGDDVVAGTLAAIALRGQLHREATEAILAHAASATTSLSSSLLRCAAAGQVVPQAARMLSALCGAAPLAPALDDLLAVGGTSGTALAIGLVAGARAVVCAPLEAAL
jgi:hypothetical protein